MGISSGNQSFGRRRRGRDLPVRRWLQIGTAATGLGVALLVAPAVATADDGSASSGSNSTKPADSSRGTAGTARTHNNAAKPGKASSTADRAKVTVTPSASASNDSHTNASTSAVVATQTSYPAQVTAPVTEKGIVTEALRWAGLGDLGAKLPVPDAPVADVVEAAWIGVRRFHYTYFNSRPTMSPGSYTQDLNTGVITGKLGGHDADGDVLTYKISTAPKHGTLTIADDGTYTYTPDPASAHAGGTEKFGITVEDNSENPWHNHTLNRFLDGVTAALARRGLGNPPTPDSTAIVAVAIGAVNHAPTITTTASAADPETATRIITATATDSDGDATTLAVTAGPGHGTLAALSADEKAALGLTSDTAAYRYTPDTAYAHTGGTDAVSFTATDSRGATTQTSLTLATASVNHAPTVTVTTSAASADGSRIITTSTGDSDGDPVTVTASAPGHGTLAALTTAEKTALGISTNTTAYRYTPTTAFAHTGGTDTIAVTATDSYGASSQTPVTLDVAATNQTPTVTLTVGGSDPSTGKVTITPTINDTDGDTVTLAVSVPPVNGVVTANADGTFTYTPKAGFTHTGITETITFTATDAYGATAQAIATVVVTPINHAPTLTVNTASATVNPFNGSRVIILTPNDSDGDAVTVTASTPGNGTLTALTAAERTQLGITGNTAAYRYTPDAPFAHSGGTDAITFTATDSLGTATQVPVTITVAPINHAPTMGITIGPANSVTGVRLITVTVNDSDGDPATAVVSTGPTHGNLANNGDGTYTYTPDSGYVVTGGPETISFTATDNLGATRETPVTFTVAASNHLPTVNINVGVANANTGSRIIIATPSDADGDAVTLAVTRAPTHGTLSPLTTAEKLAMGLTANTAAYRYTPSAPNPHAAVTDSVGFGVTDSHGAFTNHVITFTVNAYNNDPTAGVAVNDPDPTTGAVGGTVVGTDADGDSLTYTVSVGPVRGTVTVNPTTGQFTYIPSDDARAAAEGVGHTFTGTGWVTGSNFNSVNSSYPPNQTLSQYVVFDSAMQQGGTFNLSVNTHAGGGSPGQADTANVRLDFYRADGTVVTSARSLYNRNLSQASSTVSWTTIGLSYDLSQADAAQTAYVKVSLIGVDGDFWAGNYGAQWTVPTLRFNGDPTNILYNPEFGQVAQGWTGNVAGCGSQGATQACVTNSGVGANAGGGGYDPYGGSVTGHAGGYSNTLSAVQLLTTVNNGGTLPAELSDSFGVTVADGHGGSTTVVVDVPVTPSSTAAGPGV